MENIFFDLKKLKYLGAGCIIGKTVRIRKPEECIIHDGVIIDDFAYISCGIEIGEHSHIASHVSISGGAGRFTLGKYATLSNHCSVHCASSDYQMVSLDLPSVPANLQFGGLVADITIGDFATIGAHSCILPGTIVPEGFACGAYSLLQNVDYNSWSLYAGVPAKFLKKRDTTAFRNHPLFKQ